MPAAITDADIARARKHLGYGAARPSTAFLAGWPSFTDAQYIFETSIQNLVPANVPHALAMLDTLDKIECQQMAVSVAGAPATSVEDVKPNLEEPAWLEREYVRWAKRLAELLACPVCPWAERFATAGHSMTANIAVR